MSKTIVKVPISGSELFSCDLCAVGVSPYLIGALVWHSGKEAFDVLCQRCLATVLVYSVAGARSEAGELEST